VAGFEHLTWRTGRRPYQCVGQLFAGPCQFAERNLAALSVGETDRNRVVLVKIKDDGDLPGVDARLISRAGKCILPVAVDIDVAHRAAPAMPSVISHEAGTQGV